jgi:hypothetical protein
MCLCSARPLHALAAHSKQLSRYANHLIRQWSNPVTYVAFEAKYLLLLHVASGGALFSLGLNSDCTP